MAPTNDPKSTNNPDQDWKREMKMKNDQELKLNLKLDLNMDEKKLRRIMSNKLSARRCRMKRSQYIDDMEKKVKDLECLISVLTSQVDSFKEKRNKLLLQHDSLQKLVEIHSSESMISEIELEQKRLQICRLKEIMKTLKNSGSFLNFAPEQMQDLKKQK